MDTIIGAAWLRSVDTIIDDLDPKQKRDSIKKIDRSFGDVMDQFWDSVIENKVDQSELYQFAFSFFVGYYKRLLDVM
jgi:hypothetical protein